MKLLRSKDRKVTNLATPNGKQAKIANTFGLPAGLAYSCPGATSICEKICYAGKLEKIFPSMRKNLLQNWAIVKSANEEVLESLLHDMIVSFKKECEKNNVEKLFRIHWDGDFFSPLYARVWRKVIKNHTDVQFWVYTRVGYAAAVLHDIDNLSLYFSTDDDNVDVAVYLHKTYKVKLAFLDETFEQGMAKIKALIGEGGVKCPENNKKIPLISDGKGACVKCGLCVHNRNHVLFSIRKK